MFMKKRFRLIPQKGQTLIEVIVALALGIVIIVALVGLGTRANRSVNFAKIAEVASKYAQEGQEAVRQIRDLDGKVSGVPAVTKWSELYDNPIGSATLKLRVPGTPSCTGSTSWCLETAGADDIASDTAGIVIKREVTLSDNTPAFDECRIPSDPELILTSSQVKSVLVKVTWTDSSGDHEINLQSCVTRKT